MIFATVSSHSCFFLTVWSFSIFGCKEYNQSDFGVYHLMMFMCRVFSSVVGRGCLLWPAHSLGRTLLRLCPASFRIPRPNLPVTPGVSWLPTFTFQSPVMKRTYFLSVNSKRSFGLHRTAQLQLLQYYWLRHRLGLPWYWMVCLGNEQRSFCHFWDCIQVLHFGLLLTMMATPFLLRDSTHNSRYDGHLS